MADFGYLQQLANQVRALDTFGSWDAKKDDDLLEEKYVKTPEQLKAIPIIADIDEMLIKDLRMILQAVAVAFEAKTRVMASVVLEMSHEGFGRGVVIADGIVLADKTFRDAHRFAFASLEKLEAEGNKMIETALKNYEKLKPCKG